jgi:Tat protein translocase TatB subunit
MMGIGFQEMLVIIILALVLIGPKKLPEIAKTIGKALAEFRRAVDEVKGTIDEEMFKEEKDYLKGGYKETKDYFTGEYEGLKDTVETGLEEKTEEKSENREKKE